MTESINETTVFWYSWFSLYGVNAHDIRKRGMIALDVSKNVSKSHFPSTEMSIRDKRKSFAGEEKRSTYIARCILPSKIHLRAYERKSVMLTTNLVFSEWQRIFKDPMTTLAAIDRVVHHSVILDMMAMESYRAKEANQMSMSSFSHEVSNQREPNPAVPIPTKALFLVLVPPQALSTNKA